MAQNGFNPPREAGRLVFLSSDGSLYLDTGSEFAVVPCRLSRIKVSSGTDVIINKSDAEVSSSNGSVPTKVKELYAPFSGKYTVYFELHVGANTIPPVYGQIYRNGVAYGSEHQTTSSTYVSFQEELYFDAGDLVELYIWTYSVGSVYARNFRLLCSDKI